MSETSLGSSSAVEKQIDQMETMATAFVIPSLVVILAAAAIPKEFEIFSIQLKDSRRIWHRAGDLRCDGSFVLHCMLESVRFVGSVR